METQARLAALVAAVFVGFAPAAQAQLTTDHLIPYQGTLELDGVALSGAYDFWFELYPTPTGGDCQVTAPPHAECLWADERTSVEVVGGAFSVVLGSAANPLGDAIWQNAEVYLGIRVAAPGDAYTTLAGRQRILAVPMAARAETAKDYRVTGALVVDGGLTTGGILPRYQTWSSQGTGDGGAGIYNDGGPTYRALMVVGNSSAGGARRVRVYDDLTVNGSLSVVGTVVRSNCAWYDMTYTHVSEAEVLCPDGHFVAGLRTRYSGTYVDVYPGRVYCCKLGT